MCFTKEKKVFDQRACTFFKVSDSRWVFYFHSSQSASTFHSFRSLPLVRQHGTNLSLMLIALFSVLLSSKRLCPAHWGFGLKNEQGDEIAHISRAKVTMKVPPVPRTFPTMTPCISRLDRLGELTYKDDLWPWQRLAPRSWFPQNAD